MSDTGDYIESFNRMSNVRNDAYARILLRRIVAFWDSLDAVGAGPDIEIVAFKTRMDDLLNEARALLERND